MAEIMLMKTPAELRLGEQFKALDARGARADAFAAFAARGLPHRRIEAWHYTDLRSLLREAFPPAPPPTAATLAAAKERLGPASGPRIVLVDGAYAPSLSDLEGLPEGASVTPILDGMGPLPIVGGDLQAAEALGSGEAILALNAAFLQGGVVLTLAPGLSVPLPVEIVSVAAAAEQSALATRSLVALGARSSITISERHVSLGTAEVQGHHALVFAVGNGASLDHSCTLEGAGDGSLHLGTMLVRLGAEARFASFTLTATLGVVRRQGFLEFAGEGSNARFNGVSLLEGRSHADTTLVVTHTAGHCESREYYKTILDGEATGVYQGKVVVAPGAQKTDGKMLSKAIFLADGASMYNKPELEIFADDVVCGHGATVGNLDETQLFYLRARGIPMAEAQSLLLNAFAADALEAVADAGLHETLSASIAQWLARRHL